MADEAVISIKGLKGWCTRGRSGPGTTFSSSPVPERPTGCVCVDMTAAHGRAGDAAGARVFARPVLDLGLPDRNVRGLFEGCHGRPGTTRGHEWDGDVASLDPMDSVGLRVYVAVLIAEGGELVEDPGAR